MDFDRSEVGIERMAREDMIEHLRAAMVQHAPTSVDTHCPVENNEALRAQLTIAGVFLRRNRNPEWRFVVLGIEVACDSYQSVRILGQHLV